MSAQNHEVTILVNEKPVVVMGPRVTGRQIKQAAIDQQVKIGLDFVLSEELNDRRSRVVGDDELVTVNKHSKFLAIAPDDNS